MNVVSVGSSLRMLAAALVLVLLQSCGGSGGNAEAPPPSEALPSLSGRVLDGPKETDIPTVQVTVRGNVGPARTAEGRVTPVGDTDYLASLDLLSGPYLLRANAANFVGVVFSVATAPGTANVTPLTTLLVAQMLGAEPSDAFDALGGQGGFTKADDASIAAAEQRVRRVLQRDYGFQVPASLGPFVTTPFARAAGDPMYDTIKALVAKIGIDGDYSATVSAIAQESARCKAADNSLDVRSGADVDPFCPFSRSNQADAGDAGLQVIAFANRRGDKLVVRLRGEIVVDVTHTTAEGSAGSCNGSACAGVSIGAPAANLTRVLGFATTPLSNGATLNGRLVTSVPGVPLPGLSCSTDNHYYVIDERARTAVGYCSPGDSFLPSATGSSVRSGATRRLYIFGDEMGVGPSIEMMTEGAQALRITLRSSDPVTGQAVTYQCRGSDCAGATLGATSVDTSLGAPFVMQPIRIDRAVLARALPDGSLSSTDLLTLDAGFLGFYPDPSGTPPFQPVACASGALLIEARLSDQAASIPICDPAFNALGYNLRSTALDGDGNSVISVAGLLGDGTSNENPGSAVLVTATPAGGVVSVLFVEFEGPTYQCLAAACSGVTVSAPDSAGERSVSFSGTTLQEVDNAGLPADRTVVLNGEAIGPAPPAP